MIRINLQVPYFVINIVYLLIIFILSVSFSLSLSLPLSLPPLLSPPLDSNQSVVLISCDECEERRAEYECLKCDCKLCLQCFDQVPTCTLSTHTLYLYINLIFNLITSFIPCKISVIAHFKKVYQ